MKSKLILPQIRLRRRASQQKAALFQRFFKTGPGQYGEGDCFIGISVPETRKIAKEFLNLNSSDLKILLASKIHEERQMALMILVERYQKAKLLSEANQHVKFYLSQRKAVNNWDLVDLSAYKILGDHCLRKNSMAKLFALAKSKRHWDRRIAMVASFAFIRSGQVDIAYQIARILISDKEDLMHKAVGWMLREAGKRDVQKLKKFINQEGSRMPRTMLRYAIEKFSAPERKKVLLATKKG